MDYVNKMAVKERNPLTRIDNLLDKLSSAKYFSCVDAACSTHLLTAPDYMTCWTTMTIPDCTVYSKHNWSLSGWVLQFDSPNAPVIFQAVMNNMFNLAKCNTDDSINPRHQPSEFVLGCIIIFVSSNAAEHNRHPETVKRSELVLNYVRTAQAAL